jgi:hypothetical protein
VRFLKRDNLAYSAEDVLFFEHQLDLFGKLAYVSNCVSSLAEITWKVAVAP